MKESLREDIYKTYPEMFTQSKEISCGDGWYSLIKTTCDTIKYVCNLNACKPPVFAQIKQKFGRLVMYVKYHNAPFGKKNIDVYDIISDATDSSCKICEECGSDNDVITRSSGWLTPLCRECRSEKIKDNIYDLFVSNLITSGEIAEANRITTRTKRYVKAIIDAIVDELEEVL